LLCDLRALRHAIELLLQHLDDGCALSLLLRSEGFGQFNDLAPSLCAGDPAKSTHQLKPIRDGHLVVRLILLATHHHLSVRLRDV
jgi:hypothetical protein